MSDDGHARADTPIDWPTFWATYDDMTPAERAVERAEQDSRLADYHLALDAAKAARRTVPT